MKLSVLVQTHTNLLQRFAGWHEHFAGEPCSSRSLPEAPWALLQTTDPERDLSSADLLQVATAWERADCFIWAARSHKWHRNWDPLVQSWAEFEALDPDCATYTLGLDPLSPLATIQQLLGFMVTQELLQPSIDLERQ
jgi:hypothetical protein